MDNFNFQDIKTPLTWYGVFLTGLSVITRTTTESIFERESLIYLTIQILLAHSIQEFCIGFRSFDSI